MRALLGIVVFCLFILWIGKLAISMAYGIFMFARPLMISFYILTFTISLAFCWFQRTSRISKGVVFLGIIGIANFVMAWSVVAVHHYWGSLATYIGLLSAIGILPMSLVAFAMRGEWWAIIEMLMWCSGILPLALIHQKAEDRLEKKESRPADSESKVA